jgi:NitT/TauT family transport system substrate-binding protein
MRRITVLTAALAMSVGAAACGSEGGSDSAGGNEGGGSGGAAPTVRFQGFVADPAAIPMLVMKERGIDKKHGFKAEFVEVDPDAAANTLLLGESDVAMEQDAVNMTLARQEGEKGVVFWPNLNTMMDVVVPKDSPAKHPSDLKGKKVGHFGIDSGTTSVISLMLKELYGIDVQDDYDMREAGPPALPELLKKGDVDAIFDYEPFGIRAVLETPGRYLFEPAKAWGEKTGGWSPYLTNLAAREDWLRANEKTAFAVVEAWKESVKIIEDSGYRIFAEEPYKEFIDANSDEELNGFIEYCADLPCFRTTWTQEDIDHYNEWLELLAKHDVLIEETADEPVVVTLEDFFGKTK